MTDVITAEQRKKNHEKAKKKLKIGRPHGKKEIGIGGVVIGVRISRELKEKISKEASLNGFTLSAFISMTLKNFFGGK